jgi:hypothetical protein
MVGELKNFGNNIWQVWVIENDDFKSYYLVPESAMMLESYHDNAIVEVEIINSNTVRII